jgi:hypothetical protein
MQKFDATIDYSKLTHSLTHKTYKLADVKDRLIKVAFDIVRFKDGPAEELWQVQNADDGDYIVARYELETPEPVKTATLKTASSHWSVSPSSSTLHIAYKGQLIAKFAAKELGLSVEEISAAASFLPAKLASDKDFAKALLKALPQEKRDQLLSLYPELS